ncbi:MAG TPA: thiamine phosphate synthase, partial [Alphaproteobacteria bacterium]|nr:thiamine phosphate synthase [Alphaproteobacteria bacterium]
ALRPVAQDRGAAFLTSGRPALALETGCDGTALLDPAGYKAARTLLGAGYIVGAWTGASRHDAMVAGEAGADFVGLTADPELIGWWAELFEVPCVAGGLVTAENARALAEAGADFLALGPAVWDDPDGPAAGVGKIAAALAK